MADPAAAPVTTDRLDPTCYPLAGLIRCADCRTPMDPAVRARTRVYRCAGACRNEIDALHAETLMWDRVAVRHPHLARPHLPVERRREVFAAVLTIVSARGPSGWLSLRTTWTDPTPTRDARPAPTAHKPRVRTPPPIELGSGRWRQPPVRPRPHPDE
ncbi:zinc ribbon domain-containing protein [Solwaraspora sp. WMMB335]|uniref:zinc ribbon domain-containing protein n=1 Tax=Solwaraspora sp. WMMB335 TaxID=3404118 RepID=UPI003B93847A